MINAEDIARLAGVSRSTVSRVVNNYTNVPDETRRKILRVIEENGYVPHASARLLAGLANKVIGLYIDNRSNYYNYKISNSSFFAPFTTAVIDSANKLGYDVLVSQHVDNASFVRFRELFSSRAVSAGIIIGTRNDDPRIATLIEMDFLIGVIDQAPKARKSPLSDAIIANFENAEGAGLAVRLLYGLGHRSIAHIRGNKSIFSGRMRLEGYLDAMNGLGLPCGEEMVCDGDFSEIGGHDAALSLLGRKNRPSAIFAANDESALGALKAAEELGIRVPEQLSVIGFDNIDAARYVRPALTTINTDKHELAAHLTENLLAALEGKRTVNRNIEIPISIVERDSCAKVPDGFNSDM